MPLLDGRAQNLEDTVTAAREGCRDAFDQLVRETYPDTLRLALALTGDPEDARDVAQDTYLRAFRAMRRFRADSSVVTWLYRITTNCAHTLRRHRQRHEHAPLTYDNEAADTSPAHDPETRAEQGAARDELRAALESLSPKLRDVIVLRDIYDLSHAEIAERLGVTESAAKVRLHRARHRLYDLLHEEHADPQASSPVASSPLASSPEPSSPEASSSLASSPEAAA